MREFWGRLRGLSGPKRWLLARALIWALVYAAFWVCVAIEAPLPEWAGWAMMAVIIGFGHAWEFRQR